MLNNRHELNVLSEFDAFKKMTEIINELKNCKELEEFESKCVGDFWEADWPEAPFEKQMTIGQVSRMNAGILLQKKSLSGKKVVAFIAALVKALDSMKKPLRRKKRNRIERKGINSKTVSSKNSKKRKKC